MEIKRIVSSNEDLDFDDVLCSLIEVCKNNKIIESDDDELDNQLNELTSKISKYDEMLQQAKDMKTLMIEKYNLLSEQIEDMKANCINKLNSTKDEQK